MSDDRGIVYVENNMPVYRASSIGMPLRCLTAARQGNTPLPDPEYLIKAADAGNAAEITVKERLSAEGWIIGEEQGFIEVPVHEHGEEIAIIRGHLDGMSIYHKDDPMDDRMLEVKSMSQNVFDQWTRHRFDAFETYAAQLTAYMHAVDKPALYVVINRATDEMEIIKYDTPPMEFEDLANKVRSVEAFNRIGTLPPCTGFKYTCQFDFMCDYREISHEDITKIPDDDSALTAAIIEYDAARDLEDTVKVMKANARDAMILALSGRKKADVGLQRVTYSTSTKKSLNMAKLREHLGDDLDDFYDTNEYTQLRVTKLKKGE